MYRCNDDTYDTLEKLTGGGELSDHRCPKAYPDFRCCYLGR